MAPTHRCQLSAGAHDVHIGAGIQQELDHRRVGVVLGRFVQRGGSAAVNGVHIGARPQQQRHDIR